MGASLGHYLRLYVELTGMNWRAVASYRSNFLVGNLGVLLATVASAVALLMVFRSSTDIAGWSASRWLLLLGLGALARALWDSFFIGTIELGTMVREGLLDEVLTRPVRPLFLLLTRRLDPHTWGELLFALGVLIYGITQEMSTPPPAKIVFLLLAVLGGVGVYAGVHLLVNSLAVWTIEAAPFSSVLWRLDDFTRFPLSFYPTPIVLALTWLVPLGFVNYYPVLVLLDLPAPWFAPLSPLIGIAVFALAVWAWERSVDHYTSTGS